MSTFVKTIFLLFTTSIFYTNADANSNPAPTSTSTITSVVHSVPAHSRSVEMNAKNATTCAEMGGVDITDSLALSVGGNVANTVVCSIVDNNKYSQHLKMNDTEYYQTTGGQKHQLSASNILQATSMASVFAPSGYYDSLAYRNTYSVEAPITINGDSSGTLKAYAGLDIPGDYYASGNMCRSYFTDWVPIGPTKTTTVLQVTCYGGAGEHTSHAYVNIGRWSPSYSLVESVHSYGTIIHPSTSGVDIAKNLGNPENTPNCALPSSWQGNPINVAIGNKFQQEVDVRGSGSYPLALTRSYNSMDGYWRNNYSMHLSITGIYLKLVYADGRVSNFYNNNGLIFTTPTELGVLTQSLTGWQYKSPFNEVFDFDGQGRLIKTTNSSGMVHNISYNSTSAESMVITDSFKHTLTLVQDSNYQPLSLTTSDGQTITYGYDSNKRLINVTRNNKSRTYFYENAAFPRALTGITDERGIRYATWGYDSAGRANQSSHGTNIDLVKVTYNSDGSATVTNPLGRESKFSYVVIDGVKRISAISGTATANCPMSNSSFEYNSNGLLTLQTNARGIKTSYQYNSLGQETSHTIGVGTPEAQTTTTTWNTTLNLPLTVTSSNRSITYTYDSQGRVIKQTIKSLN